MGLEGTAAPVVCLDVDGVLNSTAANGRIREAVYIDPATANALTNPAAIGQVVSIYLDPEADGAFLRAIQQMGVDIVWVTTWEDTANEEIAPRLGIGPLDVVRVSSWQGDGSAHPIDLKAAAIEQCFGDRPVVWLDDHAARYASRWRGEDRLVIAPDPQTGLVAGERLQVLSWLVGRVRPELSDSERMLLIVELMSGAGPVPDADAEVWVYELGED